LLVLLDYFTVLPWTVFLQFVVSQTWLLPLGKEVQIDGFSHVLTRRIDLYSIYARLKLSYVQRK